MCRGPAAPTTRRAKAAETRVLTKPSMQNWAQRLWAFLDDSWAVLRLSRDAFLKPHPAETRGITGLHSHLRALVFAPDCGWRCGQYLDRSSQRLFWLLFPVFTRFHINNRVLGTSGR